MKDARLPLLGLGIGLIGGFVVGTGLGLYLARLDEKHFDEWRLRLYEEILASASQWRTAVEDLDREIQMARSIREKLQREQIAADRERSLDNASCGP